MPRFLFKGYDESYTSERIVMRNIYHNGKKLQSETEYTLQKDEFCRDILLE